MRNKILGGIALFAFAQTFAQNEAEILVNELKQNNPMLKTQVKYWQAKNLEYQTGYNLYDPVITYDYMRGNTNRVSGNQTEVTVIQRFDFPSVYKRKKEFAQEQMKQGELYKIAARQDLILEAHLAIIELVYRNKLALHLAGHKKKTTKFVSDFQKKMNNGYGTILEVNKAKLELIEITKKTADNITYINRLNQKLTSMNGGKEVQYTGTAYPDFPTPENFENLIEETEKFHPVLKYLKQQKVIAQKDIEVSKAMKLPKLEVGYRYQGLLDQNFHGARVGMSIPVWENRSRVEQKEAEVLLAEMRIKEHENEHYYELKQVYEQLQNLSEAKSEYQKLLKSLNSIALLDKALMYGEITTFQYFLETSSYYEAERNLLQTEKEYYDALAQLNKFAL